MAKYTESKCRSCRREGAKLSLKGERCFKGVCAFEKRPVAPGQHGMSRKKVSEYGLQLREKQKAKRIYGVSEKQFLKYYTKATEMRGVTGENMLVLIERRLDNVVYRLGLGSSRAMARQIVNHGHITVNGHTVDIPSYLVKAGDVIAVKENKKDMTLWQAAKEVKNLSLVKWLEWDNENLNGKVIALPERSDIDADIKEHLIVELYSK